MAVRKDIDRILKSWEYQPNEVSARLVRAADGREVIQLRIDMGLLQMEVDHRPDGTQPGGAETYFDYLLALAIHEGEGFQLSIEQCMEVDREFVQFYQRRLCWLALRRYDLAIRDADHSLALMDFVRGCSPSEEWTWSHEKYRPFVIFHRTQAAALGALERDAPDQAIEAVNVGLDQMQQFYAAADAEEAMEDDELAQRLQELRESIRDQYQVGRTLLEQLNEAVAAEEYERAAQLRDQIARRDGGRI